MAFSKAATICTTPLSRRTSETARATVGTVCCVAAAVVAKNGQLFRTPTAGLQRAGDHEDMAPPAGRSYLVRSAVYGTISSTVALL